MDIQVLAFYFLVSFGAAILGFLLKSRNLGGLSLIAFAFTGLTLLFNGVDVNTLQTQTQSLNATDLYLYNWNATFNQSTVANVTTNLNRTVVQTYAYANQTDSYTSTFSAILIAIGILIGLEAFLGENKRE